jgi:hypothetical protein
LEAATDLSLALGSLWLWIIFPFDFTHLADPFHSAMRSAFAWITNNVGRVILLLQVIIGFLSGLSSISSYQKVKKNVKKANSVGFENFKGAAVIAAILKIPAVETASS